MNNRRYRGGLLGPTILIAVGVIFLLINLGYLRWDIWLTLIPLWPLMLVAVGLDILIGGRSLLGSLLVVVLTVLVFAGGIWLLRTPLVVSGQTLTSQDVSASLQGASRAEVQIAPAIASLSIGSLAELNSPQPADQLVIGTVNLSADERVSQDLHVQADTAHYVLKTQQAFPAFPFSSPSVSNRKWSLKLNPKTPLSLTVDMGLGEANIDLSYLNVTSLEVNSGLGATTVILAPHGQLTGRIAGGIGESTVRVPASLAVRFHLSTGIGQTIVPPNYQRQGDYYLSPSYGTAVDRAELEIGGGIGKITIQQIEN